MTQSAENDVAALAQIIRPWTLCDDGGGFDHGSERAARAILSAGYTRAPSGTESCACPREWITSGGGCQCVIPPASTATP